MQLPEETMQDALKRLRRIEGQVAGIGRMLESGRQCADVITQISAASRALEQVGFKLLATGMRYCATDAGAAAEAGFNTDEIERLFLKLA
jgi:CsoR family transcriptional regulator, copper-sensing transcriptional repressor